MAKFEVRYEIEDGYAGGARPQSFEIESSDFEDMTDQEIEDAIYDQAIEDMQQKVSPVVRNLSAAVEFVRESLKAKANS